VQLAYEGWFHRLQCNFGGFLEKVNHNVPFFSPDYVSSAEKILVRFILDRFSLFTDFFVVMHSLSEYSISSVVCAVKQQKVFESSLNICYAFYTPQIYVF